MAFELLDRVHKELSITGHAFYEGVLAVSEVVNRKVEIIRLHWQASSLLQRIDDVTAQVGQLIAAQVADRLHSRLQPDSIVYADRLPAEYLGKKGFIYFFKYKEKKDDLTWKLATVGLVPENPKEFVFEDSAALKIPAYLYTIFNYSGYNRYDLTEFSDNKLKDDEPMDTQLKIELKKILYSHRDSAKEFYNEKRPAVDYASYGD